MKEIIIILLFIVFFIFDRYVNWENCRNVMANQIDYDYTLLSHDAYGNVEYHKVDLDIEHIFKNDFSLMTRTRCWEENGIIYVIYSFEELLLDEFDGYPDKLQVYANKKIINYYQKRKVSDYADIANLVAIRVYLERREIKLGYYHRFR